MHHSGYYGASLTHTQTHTSRIHSTLPSSDLTSLIHVLQILMGEAFGKSRTGALHILQARPGSEYELNPCA